MFENCRHVQSEDGLPVTASAADIAEMSIDSTLRGQDREVSPSRSAQKDEACSLLVPAHLPNAPGAGRRRGEPRLRPGLVRGAGNEHAFSIDQMAAHQVHPFVSDGKPCDRLDGAGRLVASRGLHRESNGYQGQAAPDATADPGAAPAAGPVRLLRSLPDAGGPDHERD